MTLPGRWTAGLVGLVALCLAGAVHAGRSCEAKPLGVDAVARGLTLAERTHQALDAEHARSGTQVVVLARAGQDLSAYGLRYSHLGFAYRTPEGAWRVVHKLNHCGTATAALYRQGLGEFFLDDLWRHEAAWVVPAPEVQARLAPLLRDTSRVAALHQARYNLVSYPWSVKYQQSNQWAIETLALAMEPGVTQREQAQAWLRLKAYAPTTLRLGPFTRLGARVSAANVAFDDHPDSKRFADRIETVTVDSVFAWLPRAGLGGAPVRLALP
ncbi:MAG: DUF2145 domain-containing protein [Hydrogenophaga sp.]|nr:DUF2145 domain-containing protein [Burkholderiaceae bacterium]MDZ4127306.1 DUF2145 domain-containing protein [Hydrogenophaga sp.]